MLSKTTTLDASEHSVKSVTIFQSSAAEVTRVFTVSLQSGRNIIEVSGLSSAIDTDSPRIHALGENTSVLDISCDVGKGRSARRSPKMESMRTLRSKKAELKAERALYQEEYRALEESTRSPLQSRMSSTETDAINSFLNGIFERKRLAIKHVRELEEEIAKLEHEIHRLEQATKGDTAAVVSFTAIATVDCSVDFQLIYLASGVSWLPFYDLRATNTAEGRTSSRIRLHYCASISQTSGEDWSNAALTLCTASSQTLQSLSIPTVEGLKLTVAVKSHAHNVPPYRSGPVPNPPMMSAMQITTNHARGIYSEAPIVIPPTAMMHDGYSTSDSRESRCPSPAEPVLHALPARVPATTVDRNPLVLSYRVDDLISLPSDGVAHKITITALDLSAQVQYVCVPRKGPAAFIAVNIMNTSDYELLPGPVSIFMNGGFVTKTSLAHVGVLESFNCVLGVDTAIKVSCEQKSRTEQESERNFAEPTKTITQTVLTTVTNKHKFDVSDVIVRSAIPLGNDAAKVKVALRKPEGLARANDGEDVAVDLGPEANNVPLKVRWTTPKDGKGGEKDGLYEWVCGVQAGKAIVLETEWDVKGPANVQWEEKTN